MTNHKTPCRSNLKARSGGLVILALALVCPSLLGSKVQTFSMDGADVTSYRTYEWLPTRVMARTGLLEDDDIVGPIIKESVNRELARRGYTEVSEGGDLHVISGGFSSSSSQFEGFMGHWGFDFYLGVWTTTAVVGVTREHREGTLAVLLIDPKTEKGVWGGLATLLIERPRITGGKLDKGTAKSIDKAAKKILKKLPQRRD